MSGGSGGGGDDGGGGGGAAPCPAEPHLLDVTTLPTAVGWLVLLLGVVGVLWSGVLARFLDVAVVRPGWVAHNLPCENALYLLFSVAVADVLQASCVLVRGIQLITGHWFLMLPLCKLWSMVDTVARAARPAFLLLINGRLLRDGHWPRTLKVWLVSLVWLVVTGSAFVVLKAVGMRCDGTCGLRHVAHVPAARVWRHVTTDGLGLTLLPAAVVVYFWYRGRPPGGASDRPAEGDQVAQDQQEEQARSESAAPQNDTAPEGAEAAVRSADTPQLMELQQALADAVPGSPEPYPHRVKKLDRCDAYTPSTFTLKHFWGLPSVDETSSTSEYSDLADDEATDAAQKKQLDLRRHKCMSLHVVTEIKRKVHLFGFVLSLVQFCALLNSFILHMLVRSRLTTDQPWETAAVVMYVLEQFQPMVTVMVFSIMCPRLYKMRLM